MATTVPDVNPGAEIIAAGDILVFGALKGTAHAGSCGDRWRSGDCGLGRCNCVLPS